MSTLCVSIFRIPMDTFCCNKCSLQFSSRNKLFKHIRVCGQSDQVKKSRQTISFSFEENHSQTEDKANCIVYVLGGRLRGRTLSAVHCYSVQSQEWSVSVPMRENRGSHGAACVDGVIFSIGLSHITLSVGDLYLTIWSRGWRTAFKFGHL